MASEMPWWGGGWCLFCFQLFRVAVFFYFLVSKKNYKMSISCFQKDVDPICKIFKILLNGSSSFVVPVFSKIVSVWDFRKMRYTKEYFKQKTRISFGFRLGMLVSPKIQIIGLGSQGHVQKSWNHRNEGFWSVP